MARTNDTIAALATPNGTSALAVLRVSGPEARTLALALFGEPLSPRLARHADYRDRSGGLVDDVVAVFFAGPASYTGEDALELTCHGNPFIAQKILEDLFARGCRPAEPGEFTQRAFLSGKIDLTQAEAVMDLIHARSERALAVAQQQLRGALGRRMQGLVDDVLGALARIEAYIDFPEEDLPTEDRRLVSEAIQRLVRETDRLLITNHYGEILRNGIKTVIIGEPNAGKSSLLNRLVGRERAIVSPVPGTTRDFIEEPVLIGSHCLRLIDTAGLNPTPEMLEQLGIAKTYERIEEADLFLLVIDATRPRPTLPDSLLSHLRSDNALIVANKIDLVVHDDALADCGGGGGDHGGARTGHGLEREDRSDERTGHETDFAGNKSLSDSISDICKKTAPPSPLPVGAGSCFLQPQKLMRNRDAGDLEVPVIPVSATQGLGIEALRDALAKLAKHFEFEAGGDDIAINARHADALTRARTSLAMAQEKLQAETCQVELVASDLRAVLTALGEISGKVDNERMLDHLFASFCIGK